LETTATAIPSQAAPTKRLTTHELAAAVGVSYGTVMAWTRKRWVPWQRGFGERYTYNLAEVVEALRQRGREVTLVA
jgi:phage terminase Nu1 subunit (DNA packaging protein)